LRGTFWAHGPKSGLVAMLATPRECALAPQKKGLVATQYGHYNRDCLSRLQRLSDLAVPDVV